MKTRIIAFILLCTLFINTVPAMAASLEQESADTLYSLGLFRGTGTDDNGKPVYELERGANRAEALVMLIRLLGREDEALACTSTHPFNDVVLWAQPYVAYGFENGFTSGMSVDTFGTFEIATANMYLTFVLRALGYTDKGERPDFVYDRANDYALAIEITNRKYGDGDFVRGDVAAVSKNALSQTVRIQIKP